MTNCLFPWCLPKSLEFVGATVVGGENNLDNHRTSTAAKGKRRLSKSFLKVDGAGVLQVPQYRWIPRDQSKLLSLCWSQEWDEVLMRCITHPHEAATHRTQHSGRTAMHLATFNHSCPLKVAQALLKANRHMVIVQDANWYTPLHNIAFFRNSESLMKIMCDTAIMVEQELADPSQMPPKSGTSPLFLAAKRAAPLRTIRQLLETRTRTDWIAPSTGGEPYFEKDNLDEYSSPLEIMLRTRAQKAWGLCNTKASSSYNNHQQTILQPRMLWQMKQIACERLRVYHLERDMGNKSYDAPTINDNQEDPLPTSSPPATHSLDDKDHLTSEQEMEAISLWSKCIELLVEHIPRLLVENRSVDHDVPVQYSRQEFAVVHCVASARVPLLHLLQVVLKVFPEQAMLRDEYGMLPLHHVLQGQHPYATLALVSMLVRHAPQAVLRPCPINDPSNTYSTTTTTTTALGLALKHGLSLDILQELLWADSDSSLTTMDAQTGLYPFALAAAKDCDLNIIYALLTAHPQVLQSWAGAPTIE